MTEKNLTLQPGQVLFRRDQPGDGMFVVRRGELEVLLGKSEREISVAKIERGMIIGEMSLFDDRPRSATVRALTEVEVTEIKSADFRRLQQKFPSWISLLMTTLTARIRSANERIGRLENQKATQNAKLVAIQRILSALDFLWYREADRIGGEWHLDLSIVRDTLVNDFCEDRLVVDCVIEASVAQKFYHRESNSSGSEVITVLSRGHLSRLLNCLKHYTKGNKAEPLPAAALSLLKILHTHSLQALHDAVEVSLDELSRLAGKEELEYVADWPRCAEYFSRLGDGVAVDTAADKLLFRTRRRELKEIHRTHSLIGAICREIDMEDGAS